MDKKSMTIRSPVITNADLLKYHIPAYINISGNLIKIILRAVLFSVSGQPD